MILTHKRWIRPLTPSKSSIQSGKVYLPHDCLQIILGGQPAIDAHRLLSKPEADRWVVLATQKANIDDMVYMAKTFYEALPSKTAHIIWYIVDPLYHLLLPLALQTHAEQRRYAQAMKTHLGNLWNAIRPMGSVYITHPIPRRNWYEPVFKTGYAYPKLAKDTIGNFAECLALISQCINDENRQEGFGPSNLTTTHLMSTANNHRMSFTTHPIFNLQRGDFYHDLQDTRIVHNHYPGINQSHFEAETGNYTIHGFSMLLQELIHVRENKGESALGEKCAEVLMKGIDVDSYTFTPYKPPSNSFAEVFPPPRQFYVKHNGYNPRNNNNYDKGKPCTTPNCTPSCMGMRGAKALSKAAIDKQIANQKNLERKPPANTK
jgi:hypothetical protein